MTNNHESLNPKVRSNVFIAGVALSLGLLAYKKLIHGRQSRYNRFRRWRKRIAREKRAGEHRPRRYNASEDPASWTLVQVPVNPQDPKPKRKRRKKESETKIEAPMEIHVTEEPGFSEADLEAEAARKRRAAWERWF